MPKKSSATLRLCRPDPAWQSKQPALLEDSAFNLIAQIEKKADFLYTSVEKYLRDAEKDKKPELAKLWNSIKEDEQSRLKMLREVKENKLE